MDNSTPLRIIDYAPQYHDAFRRLNVEWITAHWALEEADKKALDSPTEHIINRGGAILIALYDAVPVGTVALIPRDDSIVELAKMTITPKAQGKGFGQAICEAALQRAEQMGATRVYLESNTKLGPALALYQKLGFRLLPESASASPYERCNVRMEKRLDR